jgi:hypothetical protein
MNSAVYTSRVVDLPLEWTSSMLCSASLHVAADASYLTRRAASCASCVTGASIARMTFCTVVNLSFGSTETLFRLLIASPSTWDSS